jgi:hypothetical protein
VASIHWLSIEEIKVLLKNNPNSFSPPCIDGFEKYFNLLDSNAS